MSIKRIKPGPRMSQAVVHNGVVTTAGQVAQNAAGEDAITQTKDILKSIDSLLAEAGTDKSSLLTATIWLSDIQLFNEMNDGVDGVFDFEEYDEKEFEAHKELKQWANSLNEKWGKNQ